MVIWCYNSATASTVAILFSLNTTDIYNNGFTKYEYRYQTLYGTVSSLNKLGQGYGTLYSVIKIMTDNLQYLRLNKQCNTVWCWGLSTAVQLVQQITSYSVTVGPDGMKTNYLNNIADHQSTSKCVYSVTYGNPWIFIVC